jgi:DNA-binding IclR family transcriptional regulator
VHLLRYRLSRPLGRAVALYVLDGQAVTVLACTEGDPPLFAVFDLATEHSHPKVCQGRCVPAVQDQVDEASDSGHQPRVQIGGR